MQLTYFDHIKIIATNWGAAFLLAGLGIAGYGAWLLIGIARGKHRASRERIAGALLLLVAGLVWSYLQTLIPTRYATNPTRAVYTDAQAAALIRPVYEEHCAICHGDLGRGDGPVGTYLVPPPADFAIHGWHHREGEHYWWITQGISGSGMPSFAAVLSEEERWLLARYVKQLGREARIK